MDIKEKNAGLGKNHDEEARDKDIAKKQSDAKPAAENLDMMPNSVNKNGQSNFDATGTEKTEELHNKASKYAQNEHEKAKNWENKNPS
jgi:hypothetical protein